MNARRPRIAGERRRPSSPAEAADATDVEDAGVDGAPAAEPEAEEQAKPAVKPGPAPAARAPRPPLTRRARVVLAVLAFLALAAVVFAVVATLAVRQTENDAEARVDAAERATSAASTALETTLSYRHATVADDLEAATALMTPDFAAEYEQLAPQVASAAQQRKIDVAATVRAIAPLECGQECSDDSVRLLAFVDQTRTIDGKAGSPAALSIVVRMEKVDGDWLVAEMTTT
ncbi:hypothetical protein [Mumia sp. DW29H23]|uniref:hypothetical protein n=1 Tax=Mumia sp. DW29H23 TaxID=3421241 RepID=UPI003D69426E